MSNEQTTIVNPVIETEVKKEKKSVTKKDKKVVTDKKKDVTKINLSKFADKLSKIEVKEKKKKDSKYIYPDNLKHLINEKEGKQFRNSLRHKRDRIINNVLFAAKNMQVKKDSDSVSNLKKFCKEFNEFYKQNYLLNDFSIQSLSNSPNEAKNKDLQIALELIKEVLNSK